MKYKLAATAALILFSLTASSQGGSPHPLSLSMECGGRDCALLTGIPQTAGMRSGFVRLKPGESVGAHSTNENEETLVGLRGRGKVEIEDHEDLPLSSGRIAYIPAKLRHNVTNTGAELLEYVYVVAPTRRQ